MPDAPGTGVAPATPGASRVPDSAASMSFVAVGRRVAAEVAGPGRRALPAPEPGRRRLRERAQHVGVNPAVPGDDLGRPAPPPALVDQLVDLIDVQAAHLRKAALAADHARGVLLPVDDVREGVLDRPGRAGRRPRDATLPVGRTQPRRRARSSAANSARVRAMTVLRVWRIVATHLHSEDRRRVGPHTPRHGVIRDQFPADQWASRPPLDLQTGYRRDRARRARKDGTPGRDRTCDLRIRSPSLCPTELRAPRSIPARHVPPRGESAGERGVSEGT